MTICSIDFETRSAVDLKKCGAWRYFEDETADVLCAAYAFGDGPVLTWRKGQPCPPDLAAHILSGGSLAAWNAQFEAWAFMLVLGPRHGWPVPRPEQWIDTMAQAAAMSIPQSLDGAANALGIEEQKDKEGGRLIRKFSLPRKPKKGEPESLYWNEPEAHAEDFQKFVDYCAQDVRVERKIRTLLVPLSPEEQRVWTFNFVMNTRGVLLDLDLVAAMLRITDDAKARLDAEMARATDWNVTACSQVSALTRWLQSLGVKAEKLNKNAIEELLDADLPEQARRAVELRKEAAKTSTAKLVAMQNTAGADGRVRGLHLYHGAGTGRWSGKGPQFQNLPRGTGTVKNPDTARAYMLKGDADLVDFLYGSPMSAVSDMLRSCLVASPNHRLLAADYSSIEGRVTAWVAGETWVLDAYMANDEGHGPGMYELTAASIFNVPVKQVSKKDPRRQIGKTAELALNFAGGVSSFDAFARIYNVDMETAYEPLRESTDPETWERALESYSRWSPEGKLATDRMTRNAWIASEVTKVLWRAKRPNIVAAWAGLANAAFTAVQNPGTIATYGPISYIVRRGFLWSRLPSGRCLAYGTPRIEEWPTPWGDKNPVVTALGVDSVTKKWGRHALNPSILIENPVQAIARDLMAHGMLKAEKAGYPIVMTVHDEAVADVPNGFGSLAGFEACLCDLSQWSAGLPLVASGYEALSYRKD